MAVIPRVVRGPVPDALAGAIATRACTETDGRRYLLRVPDVGRFLATDGTDVTVDARDGSDDGVQRYLDGPVGAALHQQRGHVVIDGAAVSDGRRTVVLAGSSGSGTSAVAAALVGGGRWRLVSDEHVALAGRQPQPGAPRLALWPVMLERSHLDPATARPRQAGTAKQVVDVPVDDAPPPIAHVFVLHRREHPGAAPPIERIRGSASFLAVGSHVRDDLAAAPSDLLLRIAGLLDGLPVDVVTWNPEGDGPEPIEIVTDALTAT